MPESMQTITASKENIPQFIPLAMGESEAPKQVAQANADGVEITANTPMKIETSKSLARVIDN
ncbi:MAG: hypothetical protein ABIR24_09745 [Verrucomicrobiota bacterium]